MTKVTPLPLAHSQIEMRAPNSLRPYAGNARTHSPKQLRQIADSMSAWTGATCARCSRPGTLCSTN